MIPETNFAEFCGRAFQQTFGISMVTNCVPLLADFFCTRMKQNSFRESCEVTKNLARSFSLTFRYIVDVLSLNNTTYRTKYIPVN